ncbi:MAG: TIGR02328 family protein [Halanaerobiaceae bacterium]
MRLWHQKLISGLPRGQLLGQHRECCALRGKGWGRKHSTVNYVFNYSLERLVAFHLLVMKEMEKRGYNVSEQWFNPRYRGKNLGSDLTINPDHVREIGELPGVIYPEHNRQYLKECLRNLQEKGVVCCYFGGG